MSTAEVRATAEIREDLLSMIDGLAEEAGVTRDEYLNELLSAAVEDAAWEYDLNRDDNLPLGRG